MGWSCTYCSTNSLVPVIGDSHGCGCEDWSWMLWHLVWQKLTDNTKEHATSIFSEQLVSLKLLSFTRQWYSWDRILNFSTIFYNRKILTAFILTDLELQDWKEFTQLNSGPYMNIKFNAQIWICVCDRKWNILQKIRQTARKNAYWEAQMNLWMRHSGNTQHKSNRIKWYTKHFRNQIAPYFTRL